MRPRALAFAAAMTCVAAQARAQQCVVADVEVSPVRIRVGERLEPRVIFRDAQGTSCAAPPSFTVRSGNRAVVRVERESAGRVALVGASVGQAAIAVATVGPEPILGAAPVSVVAADTSPAALVAAAPARPEVGAEWLVRARAVARGTLAAVADVVEVFRGAPAVIRASSPARLPDRERQRWGQCAARLDVLDSALAEARALTATPHTARAAADTAAARLDSAAAELRQIYACRAIEALIASPERYPPWRTQYEVAATAFHAGWYAELRRVHNGARQLAARAGIPDSGIPAVLPATLPLGSVEANGGAKLAPAVTWDGDQDGVPDVFDRPRAAPGGSSGIDVIAIGESREGALRSSDWRMFDGTYADVWYVSPPAGAQLTIELRSPAFDPYLQLLSPSGRMLAQDDDAAGSRNSLVRFTVREAGRYQIIVNTFGDQPVTGSYTLTVR